MSMTLRSRTVGPLLLALMLPFAMAHGEGEGGGCGVEEDDHGSLELGPPTMTECPPTSTLTYEGFGRPFMESYCLRCHSAEVTGTAREGAPADHNFDTQVEAQGFADHLDRMAGAGPEATNEIMPPDGATPSLEERQQLAEWLACGAP